MRCLASGAVAEFRKDRLAAGDLNQFLDPANTRNQRVVPFLEEHPRPTGQCRGRGPIEIQIHFQPIRQRVGARRRPDHGADNPDHLQDLGDASLVEDHHRIAALDEFRRNVSLQIGKAQHEVGLERLDAVVVRVNERGDSRLRTRLRRPHGVCGHANHAIAFAEHVQRLRRLLSQADDAGRVGAHELVRLKVEATTVRR